MDDSWPDKPSTLRRRPSRRAEYRRAPPADDVPDFEFRPSRYTTDEPAAAWGGLQDRSADIRSSRRADSWFVESESEGQRAEGRSSSPSRYRHRQRPQRQQQTRRTDWDSGYPTPLRRIFVVGKSTQATEIADAVSRPVARLVAALGLETVCDAFLMSFRAVMAASLAVCIACAFVRDEPPGGGVAAGTYVAVLLGGLLLAPLYARHLRQCACDLPHRRSAGNEDEPLHSIRRLRHQLDRGVSRLTHEISDFRDDVFHTFDERRRGQRGSQWRRQPDGTAPANDWEREGYKEEAPSPPRPRVSICRQDSSITIMSESDDENSNVNDTKNDSGRHEGPRPQNERQGPGGPAPNQPNFVIYGAGNSNISSNSNKGQVVTASKTEAGNEDFDDLDDEMKTGIVKRG